MEEKGNNGRGGGGRRGGWESRQTDKTWATVRLLERADFLICHFSPSFFFTRSQNAHRVVVVVAVVLAASKQKLRCKNCSPPPPSQCTHSKLALERLSSSSPESPNRVCSCSPSLFFLLLNFSLDPRSG